MKVVDRDQHHETAKAEASVIRVKEMEDGCSGGRADIKISSRDEPVAVMNRNSFSVERIFIGIAVIEQGMSDGIGPIEVDGGAVSGKEFRVITSYPVEIIDGDPIYGIQFPDPTMRSTVLYPVNLVAQPMHPVKFIVGKEMCGCEDVLVHAKPPRGETPVQFGAVDRRKTLSMVIGHHHSKCPMTALQFKTKGHHTGPLPG